MKKTLTPILCSAALAFGFSALSVRADGTNQPVALETAKDSGNFYLTVDGGVMLESGIDYINKTPGFRVSRDATFHPGERADLDIGYTISKSFAAELETGMFWNSINKIGGEPLSVLGQAVSQQGVPLMANLVYRIHGAGPVTPYIGIGAGGVVDTVDFNATVDGRTITTVFTPAYQIEAGFKYALGQHASIGLAYKFLGMADQSFHPIFDGTKQTVDFNGVYTHSILLVFTWQF